MLIRAVLVVGVVLVATACSSQHAGPSAPSAPSASRTGSATGSGTDSTTGTSTRASSTSAAPAGYREQMLAWGRRFAQCVRENGYPHFPDPVFKRGDGTINFPDYLDYPGADVVLKELSPTNKCNELYKQMPPAPPPRVPPSAQTLRQMRAFSQCLRDHGVSEFPDPKANGTFPILGTPMQVFAPGYTLPPNLQQAWDACFDLQINWRMQAS